MRLLFLLLGFVLPIVSQGQTFRVFAGGGLIANTVTGKSFVLEERESFPSGGAGQLSVGYSKKNWEYGLTASYRRYSQRHYGTLYFADELDPLTGFTNKRGWPADVHEKLPCVTFSPFLNRHFVSGRTDLYVGVSAGYAYVLDQNFVKWQGFSFVGKREIGSGYTAGLHGGGAFKLYKGFAVRAELSADGLWMKEFDLQSLMLTAGMQYQFK